EQARWILRLVIPQQVVRLQAEETIWVIGAGVFQGGVTELGLKEVLCRVLELRFHLQILVDQVLSAQKFAVASSEIIVKIVPKRAFVDLRVEPGTKLREVGDDTLNSFVDCS